MLIRFSVQNFRSIRSLLSLSMTRRKLKSELVENSFHPEGLSAGHDLLRTAVIYGANASGKSNLVKAVEVMRGIVCNHGLGNLSGDSLPEPFLLDGDSPLRPTLFEMEFLGHGRHYIYGFRCTPKEILSEWLFGKGRRRLLLFAREDGRFVKASPRFPELHVWRKLLHDTRLGLPKEALFLPTLGGMLDGGACAEVLDWFTNTLTTVTADSCRQYPAHTLKAMEDPGLSGRISRFLAKADLGIRSLQVERDSPGPAGQASEPVRIRTAHVVGRKTCLLDMFRNESAGTRNIFALSGPLLEILRQGKVLFLDELDAGLHPLLVSHVLDLFHERNDRNAQMVMTAHSPAILTETLLRKDQVWFAGKDTEEDTGLVNLADFTGLRKNFACIAKDYLHGCFGGVPNIQDLHVD